MGENPTRPALNKELSYLQERALSPAATPPPAGACCIREPVCLHPHWTERGLLRLPTEVLCSRTQPLESLRRAHEIRAPSKHPASQPAQRKRRPGRARHAHTPLCAAAVRSQDPGQHQVRPHRRLQHGLEQWPWPSLWEAVDPPACHLPPSASVSPSIMWGRSRAQLSGRLWGFSESLCVKPLLRRGRLTRQVSRFSTPPPPRPAKQNLIPYCSRCTPNQTQLHASPTSPNQQCTQGGRRRQSAGFRQGGL